MGLLMILVLVTHGTASYPIQGYYITLSIIQAYLVSII